MPEHAKKEADICCRIDELMIKLDENLEKMESSDSKLQHFLEQEKALGEIKTLLHKEVRQERMDNAEASGVAYAIEDWADDQYILLREIGRQIDKLEEILDHLDDSDSKIKGFFEQQKAIHYIKSILKKSRQLHMDA